jgi:hypothetical protein
MSLLHHAKSFLELGLCKEYSMARKTTGTTSTRSKKVNPTTETPAVEPVSLQVIPEQRNPDQPGCKKDDACGSG